MKKKVIAADKVFRSTEVVLSEALSHCKDWIKVMTGVTDSAEILRTVSEKALAGTTHSKAFVDVIGMTNKESDLFSAVKVLFDTISAYSKLAKSGSIAQQVLEYVFTNVEVYGGMEKLNYYLQQLEADTDRLKIEFPVGAPGEVDKVVELVVTKKTGNSAYSVKRTKMLSDVVSLMGEYVDEAGRKYKEAVTNIQNLNRFLVTVNEYSSLKKPEDRDRVEQQLMQNPLWEKFAPMISFPEEKDSFKYNMEVKDPDMQVVSFMLRAGKVIQAALADPVESIVVVDVLLETLCLGLIEVSTVAVEGLDEVASEEESGSWGMDLALAASFKRKAMDVSSDISTEELLRARQVLEEAGISEEIIFMLPSVPEVTALNKIVAHRRNALGHDLVSAYAEEFKAHAKKGKDLNNLKAMLLTDLSELGVSASKLASLSHRPAKMLYVACVRSKPFLRDLGIDVPIKVSAALSDEANSSVSIGGKDVGVRKSLSFRVDLYESGWPEAQVKALVPVLSGKFPDIWVGGGDFGMLSFEVAGSDPDATASLIFKFLDEKTEQMLASGNPDDFDVTL